MAPFSRLQQKGSSVAMSHTQGREKLPTVQDACKQCRTVALSRTWWLVLAIVVALCGLAGMPFYDGDLSGVVEYAASSVLTMAIVSGMIAIHRHVSKFQEFGLIHVLDGRIDAMIYVLLSFSTALCVFGLAVRTIWSWNVGWEGMSETWKILHLSVDIGMGGISTGMHLLVNKVLNSGLWDQCKRL